MNNTLVFTGSNPQGYKVQIRCVPNEGYSLFTWFDNDITGVIMWNEKHGLIWDSAFCQAIEHLNTKKVSY